MRTLDTRLSTRLTDGVVLYGLLDRQLAQVFEWYPIRRRGHRRLQTPRWRRAAQRFFWVYEVRNDMVVRLESFSDRAEALAAAGLPHTPVRDRAQN